MSVRVYGASDDLIEVEGDVNEEFNGYGGDDGFVLGFSTGVLLRIVYDRDGTWRISPISDIEGAQIVQAPGMDEDNYSDVATVTGDVSWVVFGREWARKIPARGDS